MRASTAFVFIATGTIVCQHLLASEPRCKHLPAKCHCSFRGTNYNITCRGLSVSDNLLETLGTYFSGTVIQKLTVEEEEEEVKYSKLAELPARSFSNLTLEHFDFYYTQTESVSDLVFDGSVGLKKLNWIGDKKMKHIPSSVAELNLTEFSFSANNLSSVGVLLQNMTFLKDLALSSNIIEEIHPEAFVNCVELETLDLSSNRIKQLHQNLFQNIHKLKTVRLSNNRLASLEGVLAPFSVSIQTLLLDSNLFTRLSLVTDVNVPNLSYLNLVNNIIGGLEPLDFTFFESLQFLKLDNNTLIKIEQDVFYNATRLELLSLEKNNLTDLPQGLFSRCTKLEKVYLKNNGLRNISNLFRGTMALKHLDLSHNQIESIDGAFQSLSQLRFLSLENNSIDRIPEGAFRNLSKLEALFLQNNALRSLNNYSLIGLHQNLQNLDVSFNRLETLGTTFSGQTFKSLRELKLAHNQLTNLSVTNSTNMLTIVNVGGNKISTLDYISFNFTKLRRLFLYENNLTTITEENYNNMNRPRIIFLSGNPLFCDCRLMWLIALLKKRQLGGLDNTRCAAPKKLAGKLMRELTEDDLKKWHEGCPDDCNFCLCSAQKNEISIDVICDGKNLSSFPKVIPSRTVFLNLSNNFLENVPETLAEDLPYLQKLDLHGNYLSSLERVQLPGRLDFIDISQNQISRFPADVFSEVMLNKGKFSNNPWLCDCSAEPFRHWLLKNFRVISDINETLCSNNSGAGVLKGRVISTLLEQDLCPVPTSLVVIIAFGILGILLSLSGGFIGYIRYQMPIKVWLYTKGLCVRWVKEKDLDEDKEFDAFLAFSTEELDLVKQILNELEGSPPHFKLCIHYRDFIGGELILDNISRAVVSSKKTLILFSRSFLESEWTMQEFREAHRRTMEEKLNRIILVLVGELSDSSIPPEVEAYMKTVTYLQWGEKYFWQKLRYAMPRNPVSRRMHYFGEHLSETEDNVFLNYK